MSQEGTIDKLIALIPKLFPEADYPEIQGANEEEKLAFAIRHLAIHFSKTAGKIAGVSERADHGKGINFEELKENAPKAFVNALRLAQLTGLKEEDLVKAVEEKYKEKLA